MNIPKRPKNISAVIFDLDGTLLDTLYDIAVSMNTVLERNGFATHPNKKISNIHRARNSKNWQNEQ